MQLIDLVSENSLGYTGFAFSVWWDVKADVRLPEEQDINIKRPFPVLMLLWVNKMLLIR